MPPRGFHPKPSRHSRKKFALNWGSAKAIFVVMGQGDAVMLKVITPLKLEESQDLLSQARAEAKKAGVK